MNYYDFKEKTPNDRIVEEEIETLLNEIKIERKAVKVMMYNEKNQMDAEEREKEGRAINNLIFSKKLRKKQNNYQFTRKEKIRTEIKKGDICLLTIKDEEINCKIQDMTFDSVTVLTEKKIPKVSKKNATAKIDLILNETTFKRWEKNLQNLNENGEKALKFKNQIITTRKNRKQKEITFFDKRLDKYQKQAIKHAVNSNDFFLIHGPFGTGKTTTIIELILQEVKQNHTLLVTSESNVAIDNILEKLINYDKIRLCRNPHFN